MNNDILNEIPEEFPKEYKDNRFPINLGGIDSFIDGYRVREQWIRKGMFAFVSWEWVKPFAEWINSRKCLEIMAGAGWLTKALKQLNIDVIATDNFSFQRVQKWPCVTEIEELDAVESIEKYGKNVDILIISWPYIDNVAYKACKAMYEVNPECLIVYIGEGEGGCTADIDFFRHFYWIDNDQKFNIAANNFYSWFGLHDHLYLGKYNSQDLI